MPELTAARDQQSSAVHVPILRQYCADRRYQKGEVIFHAGDPATDLHMITQGQIKLVMQTREGNERILAVLGQNDLIGTAFLLHTTTYQVDAVALTETTTCPIGREQFVRMTAERPEAVLSFAETLVSQLFASWEQLGQSYEPVRLRLTNLLLEQAERFAEPLTEGWVLLQTALRHEELAAMISATRVSVSMAISELREDGALSGSRGIYQLHLPTLRQIVGAV